MSDTATPESAHLADRARQEWDLGDRTADVHRLGDWLRATFGARAFELNEEHWAAIEPDPAHIVDRGRFVAAWSIEGPIVRTRLSSPDDLVHLCPDDPREFDLALVGYPPDLAQFAKDQQRMQSSDLVLVLIEHTVHDDALLGGFFVWGPGQRLNEMLWAKTGMIPVSRGRPCSPLYAQACDLSP